MQKTAFALFDIICYDIGIMSCFALSGTKGEANMAATVQMWGFADCKYWILSNLMQIHGYLWPRQGLVCTFLTFDRLLTSIPVLLSKVLSSVWIHFPHSDRGVVNWWFLPLRMVQSSSCLVCRFQDILLWSSGGLVVVNCTSCGLKPPKIRAVIRC